MSAIFDLIDSILKKLTIICIGIMLALVFTQVVSRYVFSFTPAWGEELARYLFVWTVFLSLPLLARTGGHMAIETLTSRISGPALKTCRIAADLFSIAFLGIMVWYGCRMVMLASFQTSAAMQIPMSYVYAVIPFGCFVMLLYTVENLVRILRTSAEEIK